jgi:hypothetical protein
VCASTTVSDCFYVVEIKLCVPVPRSLKQSVCASTAVSDCFYVVEIKLCVPVKQVYVVVVVQNEIKNLFTYNTSRLI